MMIRLIGFAFITIFSTKSAADNAPTTGISHSMLSATHAMASASKFKPSSTSGHTDSKILPNASVSLGRNLSAKREYFFDKLAQ